MKSLKVLSEEKEQTMILRFVGSIDEDAALEKVKINSPKKVVMDVGEVDSINSVGGRGWIKWIRNIDSSVIVEFINCSVVFLDYVNMIDGFIPRNGTIGSFKVPYYCESCDHLTFSKFESTDVKGHIEKIPEKLSCAKCKKDAEIDVIVPHFFKFLDKSIRTGKSDVSA